MLSPNATLALAEQVAATARESGFETVLIGAAAMSVHGYTRATEDVDFAVVVNPFTQLRELKDALEARGLQCRLNLPDDDDVLGGILSIRKVSPDDPERVDVVEIVNFGNPFRPRRTPAPAALARAETVGGTPFRCATLADLIALKLYAGGFQDFSDILNLLARNPDVDLDAVRAIASPFDEGGKLEALIDSARAMRDGGPTGTSK